MFAAQPSPAGLSRRPVKVMQRAGEAAETGALRFNEGKKNRRNLIPNEYLCVYKLCINEVVPSSCHLAFYMFAHKAGSK